MKQNLRNSFRLMTSSLSKWFSCWMLQVDYKGRSPEAIRDKEEIGINAFPHRFSNRLMTGLAWTDRQ